MLKSIEFTELISKHLFFSQAVIKVNSLRIKNNMITYMLIESIQFTKLISRHLFVQAVLNVCELMKETDKNKNNVIRFGFEGHDTYMSKST